MKKKEKKHDTRYFVLRSSKEVAHRQEVTHIAVMDPKRDKTMCFVSICECNIERARMVKGFRQLLSARKHLTCQKCLEWLDDVRRNVNNSKEK